MTVSDLHIKTGVREIPVMEAFYTIQGEGFHQGKAAYFIRLAGCDVGCHWCDVKESWKIKDSEYRKIERIIEEAQGFPSRTVVITGGEPLMHDLTKLTNNLKQAGFSVHLETSGAYPLKGKVDWYCLSPKKFKIPIEEAYEKADELKVVIFNRTDFKWAEEQAGKVNKTAKLYLQPEWSRRERMMPEIVEYAKAHPKWRISLQVHKYMDIP